MNEPNQPPAIETIYMRIQGAWATLHRFHTQCARRPELALGPEPADVVEARVALQEGLDSFRQELLRFVSAGGQVQFLPPRQQGRPLATPTPQATPATTTTPSAASLPQEPSAPPTERRRADHPLAAHTGARLRRTSPAPTADATAAPPAHTERFHAAIAEIMEQLRELTTRPIDSMAALRTFQTLEALTEPAQLERMEQWPDEPRVYICALIAAIARDLQDLPADRLAFVELHHMRRIFGRLGDHLKVGMPGHAHGLALDHMPRFATWIEDASALVVDLEAWLRDDTP